MQSEFSPPLTRLDVVLWFLRALLWYLAVGAILSLVQPVTLGMPFWSLQWWVGPGIPIVVLLIFPRLLATGVLGAQAREPVGSIGDLRSLVGRCVGLALLVGCLGWAVVYSFYVLYSLVPNVSSVWLFGSGAAATAVKSQIVVTAVQFFVGFALAFGPAIRASLRAR